MFQGFHNPSGLAKDILCVAILFQSDLGGDYMQANKIDKVLFVTIAQFWLARFWHDGF